ncbi:MAG: hypothetical protein R3D89_06350 [Sphingomonadaceae bacterium]|jgi:hypothetical protein
MSDNEKVDVAPKQNKDMPNGLRLEAFGFSLEGWGSIGIGAVLAVVACLIVLAAFGLLAS